MCYLSIKALQDGKLRKILACLLTLNEKKYNTYARRSSFFYKKKNLNFYLLHLENNIRFYLDFILFSELLIFYSNSDRISSFPILTVRNVTRQFECLLHKKNQ